MRLCHHLKKKRDKPSITVLMSIYAGTNPSYFTEALGSVFNQTYLADEHVIVFDGPCPSEINGIISDLSAAKEIKNLKRIHLNQNMGLGYALHQGVKACKGDFIMRMDDDDICVPDRIEQQLIGIMKYPNVDVFGGQIIEFGSNKPPQTRSVPQTHEGIKRGFGIRNMVNHVTVCMRRSSVLAAGNYDPRASTGFEDYELWQRMLAGGFLFRNLPNPLVLARFKCPQLSRRSGFSYLFTELKLHFDFLLRGYTTPKIFIVAVVIRFISRLLPRFILQLVYRRILRQPLSEEHENLFWGVMGKDKKKPKQPKVNKLI